MLELTDADAAMLNGDEGPGARLAMRLVVGLARAVAAPRLIDVTRAHVDGCLFHGIASVDFVDRLLALGARVRIPTTLNVGSVDLLHPELFRGPPTVAIGAQRLMESYEALGCAPTFTCAPYQLLNRPRFGENIVWAESNAIVYANSVIGARTNRYGDFIDICAACTGRVPDHGLHRTEHRRAAILVDVGHIPLKLREHSVFYPVLGHYLGGQVDTRIPVIDGLADVLAGRPPQQWHDWIKALGAAAASSGAVAMVHIAGITPEAPTLETALQGQPPLLTLKPSLADLRAARDDLSTPGCGHIAAVSLGTPHASLAELMELDALLVGKTVRKSCPLYVSTSRTVATLAASQGILDRCEAAGVTVVTDTCTYITPIICAGGNTVMTNSAKWAYYAPGNLGLEAVFGSLEECVSVAVTGELRRDDRLWR